MSLLVESLLRTTRNEMFKHYIQLAWHGGNKNKYVYSIDDGSSEVNIIHFLLK